MEVVAAASGIISLLDLAKTLVEIAVEIKASMGMVSGNHNHLRDLATDLVESLEQIMFLVEDHQHDIDAGQLRDSLVSLQSELQTALIGCEKMFKTKTRVKDAFLAWKDRDDIAAKIVRLEKKVERCYQRFSIKSSTRVELAILQSRAEINSRLDRVEAGLQHRMNEAKSDPVIARDLVGIERLNHSQMKEVIRKASQDLDIRSRTSLEKQYLQTIIKTLTDFVSSAPVATHQQVGSIQSRKNRLQNFLRACGEVFLFQLNRVRPNPKESNLRAEVYSWFLAHYGPSGDPAYDRENVVWKVLSIIRVLRAQGSNLSMEETAEELHVLSMSLNDLGMYQESLQISLQDIRIYRNFANANPHIFDVHLAESLRVAATCSYRLGDFTKALEHAEESLGIARKLSTGDVVYKPILASILNTFSYYLKLVGRSEEAITHVEESLAVRRMLVADRPDLYSPDLSESLLNASLCYGHVEQYDKAFQAAQEAIDVYRLLAREKPEIYEAPLAAAFHNTSRRLIDLGNWPEALRMAQAEFEIHRKLAYLRPEVFTQKLAWSHMLLAYCFNNLGKFKEGLEQIEDATVALQGLVKERPIWGTPWLAIAHAVAAISLEHSGHGSEAIERALEMMNVYRSFIKDNPRFIHHDMASALKMTANSLQQYGYHKEALEANEEVIHIFRVLAKSGVSMRQQLAASLLRLSGFYNTHGDTIKAVTCVEEAVAICQSVMAPDRAVNHKAELALMLRQASELLKRLGMAERALNAITRSTEIWTDLAAFDLNSYGDELATSLRLLSTA